MNFDLFSHVMLLTRAGSRAYGLHTSTSDLDVKGVVLPPIEYVLGLERFGQADKPEHWADPRFRALLSSEERAIVEQTKLEGSAYNLTKFVDLALQGNPNILDVLFCRDEDVLLWGSNSIANLGRTLRQNRDLFLSAKCKHTFTGYAIAQLKRIKLHRAHLLNPPTHKPTRAEFGLPECTLIPADQLAAAQALVSKQLDSWEIDLSKVEDDADRIYIMSQLRDTISEILAGAHEDEAAAKYRAAARTIGIDDNLLAVIESERKYKAKKTAWDSYHLWLRTRNPERAALEAKHGFDVKHGMHLVRLMRMGREVLETGKVNVWRGDRDADELRAIRQGEWSYDRLIEFAEAEDKALKEIYDKGQYVVPKTPDRAKANELLIQIQRSAVADWLSASQ